eukprot:1210668-Pyramimonas_sp.AAC.1
MRIDSASRIPISTRFGSGLPRLGLADVDPMPSDLPVDSLRLDVFRWPLRISISMWGHPAGGR